MFPDLWSYSSVGIALFFGTATIIERRAYNAEAVGSNPTRTTLELSSSVLDGSFQIFFQQLLNCLLSRGSQVRILPRTLSE